MTNGWSFRLLADGGRLPEIGFGSWTSKLDQTVDQVEQAISTGFHHIDTAQSYGNELEVGKGIKESGTKVWITSKWSGKDGKGIRQSINESLEFLGIKSLDLYLIHHPRLVAGRPLEAWGEFEQLKKEGLAKSIGVSNYKIEDLEIIRNAGMQIPVVNQILLHPYVYAETAPLLAYHSLHNIVTEAYSTLIPITKTPGGPLEKPLKELSEKYEVTPAEILFAWAREKGAVILTASRSKERLETYLDAGTLSLTPIEILSIDTAGALGMPGMLSNRKKNILLGIVTTVLIGVKVWWML